MKMTKNYTTIERQIIEQIGEAETDQDKKTVRISDCTQENVPPATCLFCGEDIIYEYITHLPSFSIYKKTVCTCEKAKEYWIKYEVIKKEIEAKMNNHFLAVQMNERILDLLHKSRIGKRFLERTFDNFEITEDNKQAYKMSLDYAEKFVSLAKDGKGLLLVGNVGTGKTHLAASIANYIIRTHHVPILFGNVPSLLGEIKATYNSDSDMSEMEILDKLRMAKLLIIDDIGKEKTSDWVNEIFYSIINYRYENYLPVIVTSNLSIKELESKTGEATISRLLEMCRVIKLTSKDYRIENRNKGNGE